MHTQIKVFSIILFVLINSGFIRFNLGETGLINYSSTRTVSGNVQQTSSYCGGARPTDEMLKQFATPVAFPNKKFYIRCGKKNTAKGKIVKTFTTDQNGFFSIELKPGTYSIILEEQLKKIKAVDYINQNQQLDTNCVKDWWKKPYYLLVVKDKNISELNFLFHHRCFIKSDIPCITYTGPLPP